MQTPALERWLSRIDGGASLRLSPSVLAGAPLAGVLKLQRTGIDGSAKLEADVELAGNRITLQGQRAAQPSAAAGALATSPGP